jgi:hypothetical protein
MEKVRDTSPDPRSFSGVEKGGRARLMPAARADIKIIFMAWPIGVLLNAVGRFR